MVQHPDEGCCSPMSDFVVRSVCGPVVDFETS